jgi:3-hydroxyisobutyrate dehydrogenase/2-hydroxy-3-oxopropionate reductase
VGGNEADLVRCRPLLETFARRVLYIGSSGSGHKIKLLNQMMFGAINAMTAEMMAVASKMGISPEVLYHTITASQAGTVSNLFKELGRRISENDYSDPTFTVDLLVKDVKLGIQMASKHGAPPLMGKTIDWINEVAKAHGAGSGDTAIMWKSILKLWEKNSDK